MLGVLYESLLHPLTIISTLPSAGIGALLALLVTGTDLSIMGLIGIILLMGIVKKNAIMLIDFALEAERQRGLSPYEAIHEACMERFRPIIMTTLAALLRGAAAGAGVRHRRGAAPAAGHRDRRRADRVAGADALHDAGGVPGAGALGRAAQGDRAADGGGGVVGVFRTSGFEPKRSFSGTDGYCWSRLGRDDVAAPSSLGVDMRYFRAFQPDARHEALLPKRECIDILRQRRAGDAGGSTLVDNDNARTRADRPSIALLQISHR